MPAEVRQHLDDLAGQGITIIYGTKAEAMAAIGAQPEALRTQLGLRCIRRSNADGHHYFIVNLSPDDIEGRVPLAVSYQDAVLFNPLTGSMKQASVENGKVWLSLRSGESVILQTYDQPVELAAQES
jgi:hypothetical protein